MPSPSSKDLSTAVSSQRRSACELQKWGTGVEFNGVPVILVKLVACSMNGTGMWWDLHVNGSLHKLDSRASPSRSEMHNSC